MARFGANDSRPLDGCSGFVYLSELSTGAIGRFGALIRLNIFANGRLLLALSGLSAAIALVICIPILSVGQSALH